MAAFEDKLQALVDEVYNEWQTGENKHKGKWDILNGFSAAHQIAVVFGNFNFQVENGGLDQWISNGYFRDDAEKLIEYLETSAELDNRCRTILDEIYKLDQCAREMECDRYGNYSGPGDEGGESGFIGDLINCDTFDTWYYEHCGKDDWWEVVGRIIDKAEAQESALVRRDERDGGDTIASHPLRVYIENVHDDRIGGFTMPLPTTMEALQPFLEGAEITGWQDMGILEVMSDIDGLGEVLTEAIKKTMSQDTPDELNYLAARLQTLQDGNGCEMFAAAVETKRYNGSVTELINLTFDENLNRFELLPAFSNEQYGDFLIEQVGVDVHENAFRRLENSEKPSDNELAKYIEKLEKYVDKAAYGRDAIKAENGVLTENGLRMGGNALREIYRGPQDIPAGHRIFTEPGETGKQPLKLDDVDIAATIMKLHAVCGDGNMFQAAGNLKMLFNGHDRDYLLLADRDNICLTPAIEAYKRGTETSAFISLAMKSSAERPDFMAFAVRVHSRGEDGVTGDLIELNGKALCANAARHAVVPDRIDVVFSNGAAKSYDLWSWAELSGHARDDIRDYTLHFPDSGLAEAARRYASFMGANETVGEAVGMDTFLQEANASFMAAAQNPQPDMIRVANEAAKEILARSNADVYRLVPEGAVKLAPIEAARAMCFAEHRELAVKREDFPGLDNWSKRAVNNLLRRNERGERDKTKHKGEEL
jgi:hypothetical protein